MVAAFPLDATKASAAAAQICVSFDIREFLEGLWHAAVERDARVKASQGPALDAALRFSGFSYRLGFMEKKKVVMRREKHLFNRT
jgi:hypothetical protein